MNKHFILAHSIFFISFCVTGVIYGHFLYALIFMMDIATFWTALIALLAVACFAVIVVSISKNFKDAKKRTNNFTFCPVDKDEE
jgi:hypothetical protein